MTEIDRGLIGKDTAAEETAATRDEMERLNKLFSMPVSELQLSRKTHGKLKDHVRCVGDIAGDDGYGDIFSATGKSRQRAIEETETALKAIGLQFGMWSEFYNVKQQFDWETNPPESVQCHMFCQFDGVIRGFPDKVLEQLPLRLARYILAKCNMRKTMRVEPGDKEMARIQPEELKAYMARQFASKDNCDRDE